MEAKQAANQRYYAKKKDKNSSSNDKTDEPDYQTIKRQQICKSLGITLILEPYYRINKHSVSLLFKDIAAMNAFVQQLATNPNCLMNDNNELQKTNIK